MFWQANSAEIRWLVNNFIVCESTCQYVVVMSIEERYQPEGDTESLLCSICLVISGQS